MLQPAANIFFSRNMFFASDLRIHPVCRIFNANIEETKSIMEQDPGVKEGIFVYEAHPFRSFPGDCLPAEEIGDENMRESSLL